MRTFVTVDDAYVFLRELGASSKLIIHVKLVAEASELLIAKLRLLDIGFDISFVRLGVAFHDAGKILHPEELQIKGINHEAAGEQLLLANGIDNELARCCRSHGQWQNMECTLEELLVALADTLWKGKRSQDLENLVVKRLSKQYSRDYWELFMEMDACFEEIAEDGYSRLMRSRIRL
jgi:HD domain